MPEVRDLEPHVALVGTGATEAVARAAHDGARARRLARARGRRRPGGRDRRAARPSSATPRSLTTRRPDRPRPGGRGTACRRSTRPSRRSAPGELAVIPTDTVYGLVDESLLRGAGPAALPRQGPRTSCSRRRSSPPTSTCSSSASPSCAAAPARSRARCCPGPYTLVLPNPARRFRWLTGSNPETIGVRVPELAGPGGEVLARGRRDRRDEREPPRRARPADARRGAGADPRPRRRRSSTAASCRARRRP